MTTQIRDGRTWAAEMGADVTHVFEVPGHSRTYIFFPDAARDMPAYAQLQTACEEQGFDVLWCRARDRLGRTDALIAQVEALVKEGGAEVYSAAMPHQLGHASESSALFMSAIERAGAQTENIQRVQRHRIGIRARVKRGLHSSIWPHGYRAIRDHFGKCVSGDFVLGEIEAVKLATELFLAGKGYGVITKELNQTPWKPRKAAEWRLTTVRKMMLSDIYAGYITYGDYKASEPSDLFPALWDEQTYQEILRERQRRSRGGRLPASPVSGIAVCARCGKRMQFAYRTKDNARFRCPTHGLKHVYGIGCHPNITPESAIVEAIEADLAKLRQLGPEEITHFLQKTMPDRTALIQTHDTVQSKVNDIMRQQERLALAVAAGTIDAATAKRANDTLLDTLSAANEQLNDVVSRLALVPSVDERKSKLDRAIALPSLRSESLEKTHAILQKTGMQVICEEGQVLEVQYRLG